MVIYLPHYSSLNTDNFQNNICVIHLNEPPWELHIYHVMNTYHMHCITTTVVTKTIHYLTINKLHAIDTESEALPFQYLPFQNMNNVCFTFHAFIQTANTSSPIFPGNNCQKQLKLLLITIIIEKGSKPTAFVRLGKMTCEHPIKFHHLCHSNRLLKLPKCFQQLSLLTFSPYVTREM